MGSAYGRESEGELRRLIEIVVRKDAVMGAGVAKEKTVRAADGTQGKGKGKEVVNVHMKETDK